MKIVTSQDHQWHYGYSKTTVADIADACGMAPVLFHGHDHHIVDFLLVNVRFSRVAGDELDAPR
jgi:Bacterial regulatory proteins, tetR family